MSSGYIKGAMWPSFLFLEHPQHRATRIQDKPPTRTASKQYITHQASKSRKTTIRPFNLTRNSRNNFPGSANPPTCSYPADSTNTNQPIKPHLKNASRPRNLEPPAQLNPDRQQRLLALANRNNNQNKKGA